MLREILNDVPSGLLVVAVVSVTCGVVVLAVWLIRRYVPATREEFDSEIVAAMLGVLAALFGLLLAFVVVIEFQNHDDARSNVETKADSLAAIVATTRPWPPRCRSGARRRRDVRPNDRPRRVAAAARQRRGASARRRTGTDCTDHPRHRAGTRRARTFYDDSVRQLNSALDARRNRLADAQGGLPAEVAALIIVGSMAILSYATLVGSRSFWFHAIGAGLIAVS